MQEFWLLTLNLNDGSIRKFIHNFIHNLVVMTVFGLILEYFVLLSHRVKQGFILVSSDHMLD